MGCEDTKTFGSFQKISLQVAEHGQRIARTACITGPPVGRQGAARTLVHQAAAGISVAARHAECRIGEQPVAHPPAPPRADIAPAGPLGPAQAVLQSVACGIDPFRAAHCQQRRARSPFAQLREQFRQKAALTAQDDGCRLPVQLTLHEQVAPAGLHTAGYEQVAVVEQCQVESVERVERAVHITVRFRAAGHQLAHDLLVFHTGQSHERHTQGVDHCGDGSDLAPVTLRGPVQLPVGSVFFIVVKKGRYGIVEMVRVVKRHAQPGLGARARRRHKQPGRHKKWEKDTEQRPQQCDPVRGFHGFTL